MRLAMHLIVLSKNEAKILKINGFLSYQMKYKTMPGL